MKFWYASNFLQKFHLLPTNITNTCANLHASADRAEYVRSCSTLVHTLCAKVAMTSLHWAIQKIKDPVTRKSCCCVRKFWKQTRFVH